MSSLAQTALQNISSSNGLIHKHEQFESFLGPQLTSRAKQPQHPGLLFEDQPSSVGLGSLLRKQSNSDQHQLKISSAKVSRSLQTLLAFEAVQSKIKEFFHLFDPTEYLKSKDKRLLIPTDPLYVVFSLLTFLYNVFTLFYLPLSIQFVHTDLLLPIILVKLITIIFFLSSCDINDGIIYLDTRHVRQIYIKKHLLKDIVYEAGLLLNYTINIGNSVFQTSTDQQLINLLLIAIILFCQLEVYAASFSSFQCFWGLHSPNQLYCFLLFKLSIAINLLVCIWEALADPEAEASYLEASLRVLRILVLNSDIEHADSLTKILEIVYTVVAITGQALVIQQFVSIFRINSEQRELNHFFDSNSLNSKLKFKILSSYENIKEDTYESIFKNLPLDTKFEAINEKRYQIISNYFHKYSAKTVQKLVNCSEELKIQSGQTIFKEQEVDDCAIYFIINGQFTAAYGRLKCLFEVYQPTQIQNNLFGEVSFYTQQPRSLRVVCEKNGSLLKIKRQDFIESLSLVDKQIFTYERDQIVYQSKLPAPCFNCKEFTHSLSTCPLVTYQPDRHALFRNLNQVTTQERIEYVRNNAKRYRSARMMHRQLKELDTDFYHYLFCEKNQTQYTPLTPIEQQEDNILQSDLNEDERFLFGTQEAGLNSAIQGTELNSEDFEEVVEKESRERNDKKRKTNESPVFGKGVIPHQTKQRQLHLKPILEMENSDCISIAEDIRDSSPVSYSSDVKNQKQPSSPRSSLKLAKKQSLQLTLKPPQMASTKHLSYFSVPAQSKKNMLNDPPSRQSRTHSKHHSTLFGPGSLRIGNGLWTSSLSGWVQHADLIEFDKMCNFDYFYPNQNFDKLLEGFKQHTVMD